MMKVLLPAVFGLFLTFGAHGADIFTKSYDFGHRGISSVGEDCCVPVLHFKNLDPKGIDLGDVSLGVEEGSFVTKAEMGVAWTKIFTSVTSKVSGTLYVDYVFRCNPRNNAECPKSGKISVPFSMPIRCGKTKAEVYSEDYDWEPTGLQLAKMITNMPVEAEIRGTAYVSLRDKRRCN